MDALTALKLQIAWGADEALADTPLDRLRAPGPVSSPARLALALPASRIAPPGPASSALSTGALSPGAPTAGALPAATRAQACAEAADTLDELRAALASFDGCALKDTAAGLAFADGADDAKTMLIGDAPGAEEDRAARPFAGPPGALFDRLLSSAGLDRTQFRTALLVPWRPPGGRPPTETEIAICLPFLQRHIALVAPDRLVLAGPLVLRALLGKMPPRRGARPALINIPVPGLPAPIPALPMAAPAALLRNPMARRNTWADLRLLRRSLDTGSRYPA